MFSKLLVSIIHVHVRTRTHTLETLTSTTIIRRFNDHIISKTILILFPRFGDSQHFLLFTSFYSLFVSSFLVSMSF